MPNYNIITPTIPSNVTIQMPSTSGTLALSGGPDSDEKAKVSSNDTTAGYLNGKLVAGANITLTENNNGGNETLTITAAGGVTGFTGSQNTASPNTAVNASRLLVDAVSTNADIVLEPKGTGAVLAQLPDNTVTGGNKRGQKAVDLQTIRSANTQVASGIYSGILSGSYNTASGSNSVVAGGSQCIASAQGASAFGSASSTASGTNAAVIGGQNLTASGSNSVAIGGVSCFAQGSEAAVIGGSTNLADGQYSFVGGGTNARASQRAQYAFASGGFAVYGDCQYERYVVLRSTTTATQTELTSGGGAPASNNRISILSDATYTFSAIVTARRANGDNESAGYKIEGVIDNNAGTTAFVGTPTVTVIAEDTAAWDVVVEADNANDALVIKVTGEAGKTIYWGAVVELMKILG